MAAVIDIRSRQRPGHCPIGEAQTTGDTAGLGLGAQKQSDEGDCAYSTRTVQAPVTRFSELQAKFARKGFQLYPLTAESLLVTRWGLQRVLDMTTAERLLVQIGGAA